VHFEHDRTRRIHELTVTLGARGSARFNVCEGEGLEVLIGHRPSGIEAA